LLMAPYHNIVPCRVVRQWKNSKSRFETQKHWTYHHTWFCQAWRCMQGSARRTLPGWLERHQWLPTLQDPAVASTTRHHSPNPPGALPLGEKTMPLQGHQTLDLISEKITPCHSCFCCFSCRGRGPTCSWCTRYDGLTEDIAAAASVYQ
jgi:hypothetical protein